MLQRENDRIQDYIVRSCSDLTDDQVRYAHEAVDDRGIAHLVVHLYGSFANRAATVVGKPPIELPSDPPRTITALLEWVDRTHRQAASLISEITDQQLEATVTLPPSRQMTGLEAMMQGVTHAARHVGNILDARHLGGFETHALG